MMDDDVDLFGMPIAYGDPVIMNLMDPTDPLNRFAVIDVETANADVASICQIGVVVYENDVMVESWSSLVNPRAYFDPMNIAVHGIEPHMVKDAPTLDELKQKMAQLFADAVLCSYSAFDRRALGKHYPKILTVYPWLDVMRVARHAWREQFFYRGYGLANVTRELGIGMDKHHDALSDAKAAAEVLLRAMAAEHCTARDWVDVLGSHKRSVLSTPATKASIINEDGDYFGSVCVFTGALSLVRSEATRLANAAGFSVGSNVTSKTTHLIIGEQDLSRLNGHSKSSKERKALELTQKGQRIVFLSGQDFLELIQAN